MAFVSETLHKAKERKKKKKTKTKQVEGLKVFSISVLCF
jgi:hypothetical protein